MKCVIIDKEFFALSRPESSGLITGLKKLSENGFALGIAGGKFRNSTLEKIFQSEGIVFNEINENDCYRISFKKNKNARLVFVNSKSSVKSFGIAADKLIKMQRMVVHARGSNETDIRIKVALDGAGENNIKTGIGFFDHMLEQLAKHSNMDLDIFVKGDLHVDEHHTVEDAGIALGEAISIALGRKKGIRRYGFFLPMDDAAAKCAIDLGGRTYLNFRCNFKREKIGEMPTELFKEFFRGFASGLKANIYIEADGENEHHKIEAVFKAVAKSLNDAFAIDERSAGRIPTTKGLL